jgi:uncharacterized LabA/DUF88 family protein
VADTYGYIDGGFLRERCGKAIRDVFGVEPDYDFNMIRQTLGARRLFYYDCVEEPKANETQEEYSTRTAAQSRLLFSVAKANFCHVKLGTLKQGRRGITQKEVDVKLSVDMLTDAANKSIDHAVLVTGDLDFRPAVDSLVGLGIIVTLRYDPLVTAAELINAADARFPLTIQDWCGFMGQAFQQANQPPRREMLADWVNRGPIVKQGGTGGQQTMMVKNGDVFCLQVDTGAGITVLESLNEAVLERYATAYFGHPVTWF